MKGKEIKMAESLLDDENKDGVFDSDGTDAIGPKDLDFFAGAQDRTYAMSFIFFDEPLSKIPKEKHPELKEKLKMGQVEEVKTEGGIYIRRPRFLHAKLHWSQETGSFRCFKGACCKELGLAKPRAATLIVEYVTDREGKIKKPFNYEVKMLSLNDTLYKDVQRVNNGFPLLKTDVLLTCVNEQFKTFKAQPMGPSTGCKWQEDPDVVAEVLAVAANSWDSLRAKALGKKLSEEQFKAIMGIADTRVPTAVLSEDISDDLESILANS